MPVIILIVQIEIIVFIVTICAEIYNIRNIVYVNQQCYTFIRSALIYVFM